MTLHCHRYLHVRTMVQIFDTHPNDVGLHWIFFSKFNCNDDVVILYDSAGGTYISTAAEMATANMMFSPMPKIFVRHFKRSVQTNTNDCGFTPLQIWSASSMELILVVYHLLSKLRDHLIKGLENQNITVFPYRKLSVVLHYYCIGFICDL